MLQNVLENAPQMVHPDTRETLRRDTKVTSSDSTVHEERKVLKMECNHEEKVRVPKQPKRCKTEGGGVEDGSPPEKKRKPAGKSKLETQIKVLQYKILEVAVFLQEKKAEVDENVAPTLVKKRSASHAKSEETFASIQLTLTQSIHSDDVMFEINTAKEVVKDTDAATKAAKQRLEQANPTPKDKSKAKGVKRKKLWEVYPPINLFYRNRRGKKKALHRTQQCSYAQCSHGHLPRLYFCGEGIGGCTSPCMGAPSVQRGAFLSQSSSSSTLMSKSPVEAFLLLCASRFMLIRSSAASAHR